MQEYRFSLTRTLPYKDRIHDSLKIRVTENPGHWKPALTQVLRSSTFKGFWVIGWGYVLKQWMLFFISTSWHWTYFMSISESDFVYLLGEGYFFLNFGMQNKKKIKWKIKSEWRPEVLSSFLPQSMWWEKS